MRGVGDLGYELVVERLPTVVDITCRHFFLVEVVEVQGYPRGRGFFIIS